MGQAKPLESRDEAATTSDDSSSGSMEEILASIRKIIADEGATDKVSEGKEAAKPAGAPPIDAPSPQRMQPQSSLERNAPETIPAAKGSRLSLSSLAASVRRRKEDDRGEEAPAITDNPATGSGPIPSSRSETGSVSMPDRPVAQTPSSSPGGLAALAARIKNEAPTSAPAETSDEKPVEPKSVAPEEKSPAHVAKDNVAKPVSLSDIAAMASNQSEPASKSAPSAELPAAEASQPGSLGALAAKVAAGSSSSSDSPPKSASAPDEQVKDAAVPPASQNATDSSGGDKKQDSVSQFREALVAPSTSAAVAGSMDRLKRAADNVSAAQVEAVLRPMLKEWLDENLPSLVEKLVSEEISRIGKQAKS